MPRKRTKKMLLKIITYTTAVILTALLFCRCIICKTRWSDSKAYSVFKQKNVPLTLHDTVVNGHHLHYAETGNKDLPTLVFIHGSPGSWFHYMKYLWDTSLLKKFRMVAIDRPGFRFIDYGNSMHLNEPCD